MIRSERPETPTAPAIRAIGRQTLVACAGELLRARWTSRGTDLEIVRASPAGSYVWRHVPIDEPLDAVHRHVREFCLARGVEVPEEYRLRAFGDEQI